MRLAGEIVVYVCAAFIGIGPLVVMWLDDKADQRHREEMKRIRGS